MLKTAQFEKNRIKIDDFRDKYKSDNYKLHLKLYKIIKIILRRIAWDLDPQMLEAQISKSDALTTSLNK